MKNEIEILDMGEAAALLALGHNIARMDSPEGARYKIFVFKQGNTNLTESLDNYRNHELMINAYIYWNAIREIKKRIADMNILATTRK